MGIKPAAIRIIDTGNPTLKAFASGEAANVEVVRGDITDEQSLRKAFNAPWHSSSSQLPLTVFHTAAVIRPFESYECLYDRSQKVNVLGTANSVAAAREAGASIFIYTSSSHVSKRTIDFFFWPWKARPSNFMELATTEDFDKPLPPNHEFANNYVRSKAEAERLVCGADEGSSGKFRTGALRPGNGIYGHKSDTIIGRLLEAGLLPTQTSYWVQNWIHGKNVSLAHLQLEAALLGDHVDKIAGRPFLVTDDGPPSPFGQVYGIIEKVNEASFKLIKISPVFIVSLSYAVELWDLAVALVPGLRWILSPPRDPINLYQPGIVRASVSAVIDDSISRKPPSEGGIGYTPACTTLEGMCDLMVDWNEHVAENQEKKRQ